MTETAYETFGKCIKALKLSMEITDFASFADKENISDDSVNAISRLMDYIMDFRHRKSVEVLRKLSRIPVENPKTFSNFRFEDIRGKEIEKLRAIPNMSAIHENRNLVFIGKHGVGKTHLAMAFGLECCGMGLKTYFTTLSELNDKLTQSRRWGTTDKVLSGLVKPSCLIIDEFDYCTLDVENTRLFFHLVDRRYNKEGPNCMVITSNKDPALWKDLFCENDTLQCALDRIFDKASVFCIKGQTHRGKNREVIALNSVRVEEQQDQKEN